MKKGQRASTSSESESEESQRVGSDDRDSKDQSTRHWSSSDEDSSSDLDVVSENTMKRSKCFSSSFSFEEDQQQQLKNESIEDSPRNSNRAPVPELVEFSLATECTRLEKQTSQPQRSSMRKPQALWLAMTSCISLRWPPCLSNNRQSSQKLAYQVDYDQSEDKQSSVTSDSINESSSRTSSSETKNMTMVKTEEVRSRGEKSIPPPHRGVSRSSPRVPRDRQTSDLVLASMILEKEMFLRIELVDRGEDRDDLRYRAEWKLSEKTKELAEGVWLSGTQH